MDALLIAVAFFFGLLAQQFRLPPLVGFLISGFVLQAFGQEAGRRSPSWRISESRSCFSPSG